MQYRACLHGSQRKISFFKKAGATHAQSPRLVLGKTAAQHKVLVLTKAQTVMSLREDFKDAMVKCPSTKVLNAALGLTGDTKQTKYAALCVAGLREFVEGRPGKHCARLAFLRLRRLHTALTRSP